MAHFEDASRDLDSEIETLCEKIAELRGDQDSTGSKELRALERRLLMVKEERAGVDGK